MIPAARDAARVIKTRRRTEELPLNFHLFYAPDLLVSPFIAWANAGYTETETDVEAVAWSNQTLRNDLNMFLIAVDYVATNGG